VPVGLSVSPLIPGLNDSHIPELLARAKEAGAGTAFMSMLRLPGSVGPYFVKRLEERLPTKASRILNHIREERGGRLNSSVFGERMHGTSEQWNLAVKTFDLYCSRLGINESRQGEGASERVSTFRRPTHQRTLF
jgi:DNA repair photolyase